MPIKSAQEIATGKRLKFKLGDFPGRTEEYKDVELHGKDGMDADVYSAISHMGWPCVLIVLNGELIASSINDGSCKTMEQARAKAEYQVKNKTKRYWDSAKPIERFSNDSRKPDKLVSSVMPIKPHRVTAAFVPDREFKTPKVKEHRDMDMYTVQTVAHRNITVRIGSEEDEEKNKAKYSPNSNNLMKDLPNIKVDIAGKEYVLTWDEAYGLGTALIRTAELAYYG